MSTKLTIKNLKHIKSLEFEVPGPGAYLLTGSNGSGKTSLLTCLSRLRNSGAFPRGFRSSTHKNLDTHRGASIKYEIGTESVLYSYVEERWAPLPRKNSHLLATCGYPEVAYIAADADRVEPQKQEFSPRRVQSAPEKIKVAMNQIFSTSKFSELCFLNLSRGGHTKAYLIKNSQPGKANTYYSERNFSLGELCVLKLLLALDDIQNNSLVLIDELELAIHPRAQVKLFEYLVEFSKDKNLTVIFSTHSVTLIKSVHRSHLIFLENDGGVVSCIKSCYPTYALGHISSGEEVAPDCVIYVEDDSAKKCIEAMINLYRITLKNNAISILVVPLGGFREILQFMDRAPQMLPRHTKLVAILDKDVELESLAQYQASGDYKMLDLFGRLGKNISYLPWTPEVGFLELLLKDLNFSGRVLKEFFHDPRISIPSGWGDDAGKLASGEYRRYSKKMMSELGEMIGVLTGRQIDRIREDLFGLLVNKTHEMQSHKLVEIVARAVH